MAMPPVSVRAATTLINNAVITGTSSISGTLNLLSNTPLTGTLSLVGGTLALSSGTITGSAGIIPLSLVAGAGGGSVTQVTAGAGLTATNTTSTPQLTLTTSIPVGNLAAGSGASGTTFWRGDGTWASPPGGVTNMTLLTGGAITGAVTGSTSTVVLSLTLSSFPAASLSGTITNGQLITPTISVGGTTITLGTGATTLASLSLSSLTVSGSLTFSGVSSPVSSTGYVLQVNSTSGAISTTTASGGGGGGSVTQVTGTTGRVTVTSTTSTPVVTLPTTLTLSDTTAYLGTLSGATLMNGTLDLSPGTVSYSRQIAGVTVSGSSGQATLSVSSTTSLFVGMTASTSSTGIPIGSTIAAIGTGTVSITNNLTNSISGSVTSFSGGVFVNPFPLMAATTTFTNLTTMLAGNSGLNSDSTSSTNFGGFLQIGNISGTRGTLTGIEQGSFNSGGAANFPGGLTGPMDTITAFWKQLTTLSASNPTANIIVWGDSFAGQLVNEWAVSLQKSYGYGGIGGQAFSVSLSGDAQTLTSSSAQSFSYSPAGFIETMQSTNSSVIYYLSGSGLGAGERLDFYYVKLPNGGTFKLQTASASLNSATPGAFGAFSDEAGYTAVDTSSTSTGLGVITLTKSAGTAWQFKAISTVSASAGIIIPYRPFIRTLSTTGVAVYGLNQGGIGLPSSNSVSTAVFLPFLANVTPHLVTYKMSEGNTTLPTDLTTWSTIWSLSASQTTVLVQGNQPNGNGSGSESGNPTTNQVIQNGILRTWAESNADSGYIFYDVYSQLGHYPLGNSQGNFNWLGNVLGLIGASDVHASDTANRWNTIKLSRDMGLVQNGISGAWSGNIVGNMAVFTDSISIIPNGFYSTSYSVLNIYASKPGNAYDGDAQIRFPGNLVFRDSTGNNLILTVSSSGRTQFGANGASVVIPATRFVSQNIYIDQTGSSSSNLGGNPGIYIANGSSDSYGATIYNAGNGNLVLNSGSTSATINMIAGGVGGLTLTSTTLSVAVPQAGTSISLSGSLRALNLAAGDLSSTGTTSFTATLSLGGQFFNAATATQAAQVKDRIYDQGSVVHGFVPTTGGFQVWVGGGDFFVTMNNNATEAFRVYANGGAKVTGSLSVTTTASITGATTVGSTMSVTGTLSGASASFTTVSASSLRAGNTTSFTGMLAYSVSSSSGAATVTNAAITANSVPTWAITATAGVVTVVPAFTMFAGSFSMAVGASDTATYSGVIFIKP